MAHYGEQESLTMVASGDLSALRFHVMRHLAANACALAVVANSSNILGVLQNDPGNGEHATICYQGKSKAVAGAAVTVDAPITTTTSGRVTAAVSGDFIIGRALEAAAADGNIITVLLQPITRAF